MASLDTRHAGQANNIAAVAAIHTMVLLGCSSDSVFCRLRDNAGGDRTGRFDDNVMLVESIPRSTLTRYIGKLFS